MTKKRRVIYLTDDEWVALAKAAADRGLSYSQLVAEMLQYVSKIGADRPSSKKQEE